MGSKRRVAKEILPFVLEGRTNELYVEPFVGGANVIDKVDGLRWGNDSHPFLVALYQGLQRGWTPPPSISEERYNELKISRGYIDPEKFQSFGINSALVGFAGFACSYGGKWFGGYCRSAEGKRDYTNEAYRNIMAQAPKLKDVKFTSMNYWEMKIPENSWVYCDPPYANTTKYHAKFDTQKFWDWVREISKHSHVTVSEYEAPDDFECLWEKTVTSSLAKNTGGKHGREKLFRLKK